MQFPVGTKVIYNKPLLIGYKPNPEAPNGREQDIRIGLIGYVMSYPSRFSPHYVAGARFTPVKFPESNLLWYLNPVDLTKVEASQQGEVPACFYKADRERAKAGMSPFQLAYVEKLEAVVKASDAFWNVMQCKAMLLGEYALSEALFDANEAVNFCAAQDPEPDELPRDVIFS